LRPRPEKIALCEKNIGRIQAELDKSLGSCCPLDSPTPYTPTRLVDLGQNWDAIPHLIQPDRDLEYMKFPGKIRYAALSYCWGPKHEADQNIKTTKESVREFPTPLPLASMPQALKDAVEVCRSFSIRYLWVDTLCIFQGDLTDWEQESEKMAPIYQNAYLTICALASGSCLQGFLTRSPLSIEIPFHSKISGAIAGTYALTYRDDLASPIAGLTCLTQDLLTSKWNKRAWTFQEEKLSSRLLYFGKYRMHFSCKHQLYSENHPENMDSRLGVRSFIAQSDPKTSTEIASKAFYDDWVLLSAQYNKRILSHENDKLPALSGMAKYVGDIIQDEYVVGMWRKDLHRSLLWVRFATCETWSEFQENLACPSAANMPSWSWLSDNLLFTLGSTNSLLRQELNIFPDYTLHSVDIIHEGTNRFGRIESAVLKISGALLPVTCHFVAALTGRLWPEQIWQLNYKSQRVYNVDFDFSPEGKKFHPPEGLAMLKVAYCPSYTNDFGETTFQHAIWGLVLLPTQNPAEYRRIGIFSTHPDDPEGINPFKDATVRSIQLV
jgi:hypothetical protein